MLKWLLNLDEDALLFVGFVIVAVGVIVIVLLFGRSIPPKPCSDYANSLMKDIPARCVSYWMNEQ